MDQSFRFRLIASDIIWNKYPGICPTCFDTGLLAHLKLDPEEPPTECHLFAAEAYVKRLALEYRQPVSCSCPAQSTFIGERHQAWSKGEDYLVDIRFEYAKLLKVYGHKPSTLSGFERMFSTIFARSCYTFSLERMAQFLLEEVAEVAEATKNCYTYDEDNDPWSPQVELIRKRRLQEELADVFSCLFTLLLKINFECSSVRAYLGELPSDSSQNCVLPDGGISFAEIIWSKYGRSRTSGERWDCLKCPKCEKRSCTCARSFKVRWDRNTGLHTSIMSDAVA
jgi:NTP pyrophosphatase (non-canonical NTP hydrolase)